MSVRLDPKDRPIEKAMKEMTRTTDSRRFPAEERLLFCLHCGHLFRSGSFHCPSCFLYDGLVEPAEDGDEGMLRDLEILMGREAEKK